MMPRRVGVLSGTSRASRALSHAAIRTTQNEFKDTQRVIGLAGRLGAPPVAGASFTDRTTCRTGRARSEPELSFSESSKRRPR